MDPFKRHLKRCVNKTWNFSGKLKTSRDHLTNVLLGIGGEAGEILDNHKKQWFHSHKDERLAELELEVGDLLYYLIKLMDIYHFSLDEVLEKNYRKLRARYPEQFRRG